MNCVIAMKYNLWAIHERFHWKTSAGGHTLMIISKCGLEMRENAA